MAKPKSVYACAECGATALQWFGTCPSCGAAGTLSESYAERGAKRIATPSVALADIEARELARIPTGVGELDRALGAGLVAGRSEEHTSELQSRLHLVCRLLLE